MTEFRTSESAEPWELGCTLGDGLSCVLRSGFNGTDTAKLLARARELLTTSCTAGDGESCLQLASQEDLLLDQDERNQALAHGCELGIAAACELVAALEPARAADRGVRAVRIWLTRCLRNQPELASLDERGITACLRALDGAEAIRGPYPAQVRAHLGEGLDARCGDGAVEPCQALAAAAALAGDRADGRRTLDRAVAHWTAGCEGGDVEACTYQAQLLGPDVHDGDLIPPSSPAVHALESLGDGARAPQAWATVCRRSQPYVAPTIDMLRDVPACARALDGGVDPAVLLTRLPR